MTEFDVGIIGGGPAGYTAAIHAREKGLSVVLFEKDCLGGVCLNRGCIPTKTILNSAELYEDIKCAAQIGILANEVKVDFEKVMARKNEVSEKVRKLLELSIKNLDITVINAEAKLLNKSQIEADKIIYDCKKIVVATGSSPREIKGLEFDHEFILNSDDILELKELPKSIVIVGSGAIGIEWARIFAAFDVEVTVIEMEDRLLPIADIEVSKRLERIFKTKKIKTYLSNKIEKIENGSAHLTCGDILTPEKILVATGRVPNIIGIPPNPPLTSGEICYLGDVCGEIQLAHYAIKQSLEEISNIEFDKTLVPSVVYGNPEIAWVGKREQDLEEGTYQKANLLVSALGKSHCDNCSDGFIKILSREGQIIGAHIVSKEASALIHQILIAMQNKIGVEKLKKVCFAHPTYSEGIFECLFRL